MPFLRSPNQRFACTTSSMRFSSGFRRREHQPALDGAPPEGDRYLDENLLRMVAFFDTDPRPQR